VLVTVTSTAPTASNLSHLLRKHPDRAQAFVLSVGTAHVFYPEVSDERCTVAMLLEVDPIGLVRDRNFTGGDAAALSRGHVPLSGVVRRLVSLGSRDPRNVRNVVALEAPECESSTGGLYGHLPTKRDADPCHRGGMSVWGPANGRAGH
jgi:hypothetical protein